VTKKRGFDIASLVNDDCNDSSYNNGVNKKSKYERVNNISVYPNDEIRGFSAFHRPKSPSLSSLKSSSTLSTLPMSIN
jgi:hypothetical protein